MALKKKTISKTSRVSRKKKQRGVSGGSLLSVIAVLSLATAAGVYMIGGAAPKVARPVDNPPQMPQYSCCDSGDGSACQPNTQKTFLHNGDLYGLLKSNIFQGESGHIVPTNESDPEGNRIFLNNSNVSVGTKYAKYKGCEPGKDLIGMKENPNNPDVPCFGVPNDELIYVCKDTQAECAKQVNLDKIPFDVYFRIKDGVVPEEISTYCPKPKYEDTRTGQKIVGLPTNGAHKNLQLETFQVVEDLKPNTWLGAWCKPAINLYPTQKTNVHVEVAPQGKMLVTIPEYPKGGWDVTAYPDGKIVSGGKTFPYLYWEASLPDSLIKQPSTGYVVETKNLSSLFATILPQMGLNAKEQKEFTEYWVKALPASPYYFVGALTQSEIDTLAPLTVAPKPNSVLRVSLYFKALDSKESVTPPTLTGFERNGFTVTEWGGFFKADKNHPDFTCLM